MRLFGQSVLVRSGIMLENDTMWRVSVGKRVEWRTERLVLFEVGSMCFPKSSRARTSWKTKEFGWKKCVPIVVLRTTPLIFGFYFRTDFYTLNLTTKQFLNWAIIFLFLVMLFLSRKLPPLRCIEHTAKHALRLWSPCSRASSKVKGFIFIFFSFYCFFRWKIEPKYKTLATQDSSNSESFVAKNTSFLFFAKAF